MRSCLPLSRDFSKLKSPKYVPDPRVRRQHNCGNPQPPTRNEKHYTSSAGQRRDTALVSVEQSRSTGCVRLVKLSPTSRFGELHISVAKVAFSLRNFEVSSLLCGAGS